MRTSVIAPLGIAALMLGVWYMTNRPEVELVLDRALPDVAPEVARPEDPPAVTESARRAVPGDRPASGERDTQAAVPPFRAPYWEPELRDTLVSYLVDRGLSALDSEKVVNTAIDGLSECVASSGFDPERRAIAICRQNVLQQAGLDEAILDTALGKATSQMSRRLALEGARGFEVGVAMSFRQRTN